MQMKTKAKKRKSEQILQQTAKVSRSENWPHNGKGEVKKGKKMDSKEPKPDAGLQPKPSPRKKQGHSPGTGAKHWHKHKGPRVASTAKKKTKPEKPKEKGQSESKPAEKTIQLPESADQISSNWRKLQQALTQSETKKPKRSTTKFKRTAKPISAKSGTKSTGPDIWFDDVDDILIDALKSNSDSTKAADRNPLTKQNMFTGVTKVVGMDCEMVGVGDGQESMLARVSIVNHDGHTLYDKFVQPREKITDYRTFVSGVRPQDLVNAHPFEDVQKEVAEILKDRILVGHALHNDLKVLFLSHPRKDTRDTSKFKAFRHLVGGRTPSLKKLTQELLGVEVQSGEHSSVQDAQAAMRLYTMHRKEWEKHIKDARRGKGRRPVTKSKGFATTTQTDS